MVTIGVDQYLSNSTIYEHTRLKSIKKLYKYSGKLYDQQHYKSIIEAAGVSTTEGFTGHSTMSPSQSVIFKNPSAMESLHHFSEALDIKIKTSVRMLCATESK